MTTAAGKLCALAIGVAWMAWLRSVLDRDDPAAPWLVWLEIVASALLALAAASAASRLLPASRRPGGRV